MTKELELDFDYTVIPEKKEPGKITKFLDKFFYSYWYFIVYAFIVILGWYLNAPWVGFAITSLFMTITLIYTSDVSPLIFPLMMFPLMLPTNAQISEILPLVPIVIPIFIALAYHLIKYPFKGFKFGKFAKPQLFVTLALLMGGLGSNIKPNEYVGGLPTVLGLGIAVLVLYELVHNGVDNKKTDVREYFTKSMLALGFTVAIEVCLFTFANPSGIPFEEIGHTIIIGTMYATSISVIILITLPFPFYMATREGHRSFLYLLIGFFEAAMIVLTISRASILVAIIILPMSIIASFVISSKKKRKELFISYFFALVIIAIVIVLCLDEVKYTILQLLDRISAPKPTDAEVLVEGAQEALDSNSTSVRLSLYKEARLCFQSFPLFGVGLGYVSPTGGSFGASSFYWFHSTFWQIMASTGLFGLGMFIYNYYWRIKIVLYNFKKNFFNIFMFIALLGFETEALVDATTFQPMPYMFLVAVMIGICEIANKEDEDKVENEKYEKFTYYFN